MNHSPYEEVQNSLLKTKVLNKKCRQNKDGGLLLRYLAIWHENVEKCSHLVYENRKVKFDKGNNARTNR